MNSRKIKFRAWHKAEEFMFYPITLDLNNNQDGGFYVGNVWYQRGQASEDGYWLGNGEFELMQFTGLYDDNRKELYEGDIIDNDVEKWEIVFNKGCFCAKIIGKTYPGEQTHIALRAIRGGKLIGNIYENPELLNK